MKRVVIMAAIILLLAVGGAFFYFKGKRYEVVISQEKIDSVLSGKFPASKSYLIVFTITYSNPEVTLLKNEDRVQVGLDAALDFRLNNAAEDLGGGVTVTSGIRYDQETQEFYLDDVEFERLEIEGVPEKWLDIVTEVALIAAKEFIENEPIYQIEAKDNKTRAAKLLLKDFEVREQSIRVTLGL